jgi:hypothetical protein
LNILQAPRGQQEATINAECFGLGQLIGAGVLPERVARYGLLCAAWAVPDHAEPWSVDQLREKVNRSVDQGIAQPRCFDIDDEVEWAEVPRA